MPRPVLVISILMSLAAALSVPNAAAKELAVVPAIMQCEDLAKMALPGTGEDDPWARIETARVVSTFCKVNGYVAPQVKFEVHLPIDRWTQRMLFAGCGGYCGTLGIYVGAADGCPRYENGEFVTVSSNLGHDVVNTADLIWSSNNRQGIVDFGYRGVHVTTVVAKKIIEKFYGQSHKFAYFSGCSDGGREAMKEAQMFPEDFDGIIAGAPSIYSTLNNSIHHGSVSKALVHRDGSTLFSNEDLMLLHQAATSVCGEDGIIYDLFGCDFSPKSIECHPGSADACLTSEQVAAAESMYAGLRDPKTGENLYYPIAYGSEPRWNGIATGSMAMAENAVRFLSSTPAKEPLDIWDIEYDQSLKDSMALYTDEIDALDPNLAPFLAGGGKLIIWHGLADPNISPHLSREYYDRVRDMLGDEAVASFARLYLLPGLFHCQDGNGPQMFDMLTTIMNWVEDDVAPGSIMTTDPDYVADPRTVEVPPYPSLPRKL